MKGAFLFTFLLLPQLTAAAAPWIQEEDKAYVRVAYAREEVEGLQAHRADLYGEFGLTRLWTVTGKVEGVAYDDAEDFNAQGWRATARRRVFQRGALVGSVEVGASQGAAVGGSNGCETLGAETRVGLAWSGQWRKTDIFAFSELAERLHDGCLRHRFEFGLGQRATENIWVVSQVWIERGTQNAESDKIQTELLWKGDAVDFSVGYRQENGRVFDESGVFIAIARRF